jgi:hypothetical protein
VVRRILARQLDGLYGIQLRMFQTLYVHCLLSQIYIYIYIFHLLYSPLGPWPLIFSFMIILQTVGLLGRVISSSQGLYLNTGQHKHRINTYTYQTSIPCVGFELMIPSFERAKTVHALHRSATVTGRYVYSTRNNASLKGYKN